MTKAGRMARLRMRVIDSSGNVSLEKLCQGELSPAMTGEVDPKKANRTDNPGRLAGSESTSASNNTLTRDVKAVDDEDIDGNTVAAYLDIFKRLFIIDSQLSFSAGIRSSARVKRAEN